MNISKITASIILVFIMLSALMSFSRADERKYSVTLRNQSAVPIALQFVDLKDVFEPGELYKTVYRIKPNGELKLFDKVTQSEIVSQLMTFVDVIPFSSPVDDCQILLFNETKGSVIRFKYLTREGEEKKVQLGYRIENKRTGSDERGDYHKHYFIVFKDF